MKRPGFLINFKTMTPKHSNLGLLPPNMGPNIPGPPVFSPFVFPHPTGNPRTAHRRHARH